MIYTLNEAAEIAVKYVNTARMQANVVYGPGLFDKAVEFHTRMRLRADTEKGQTKNIKGVLAGFFKYDWADTYEEHPEYVWFDFFRGTIMNSVARLSRGLEP